MRANTPQMKRAATKALRANKLAHFTVRQVDVEGDRHSIGLYLKTDCVGRRTLRGIACLERGVLTELHVATGRPDRPA